MQSIRRNKGRVLLIASIMAIITVLAAVGGSRYTSQSAFCANCHEMQPLHSGWSAGSHAKTDCYDCHVDRDIKGHVMAKLGGIRQVYVHFTGEVNLDAVQTQVPDRRCARCHDMRDVEKHGQRLVTAHVKHTEAKLPCTTCHITSGHNKEVFVGFKAKSCQECHPKKLPDSPLHHLKMPPCTRPADPGIAALSQPPQPVSGDSIGTQGP